MTALGCLRHTLHANTAERRTCLQAKRSCFRMTLIATTFCRAGNLPKAPAQKLTESPTSHSSLAKSTRQYRSPDQRYISRRLTGRGYEANASRSTARCGVSHAPTTSFENVKSFSLMRSTTFLAHRSMDAASRHSHNRSERNRPVAADNAGVSEPQIEDRAPPLLVLPAGGPDLSITASY